MKRFIFCICTFFIVLCGYSITAYAEYTSINGGTITFKHYLKMNMYSAVPPVTFISKIEPAQGTELIEQGKIIEPGPPNAKITNIEYYVDSTTYNEKQPEDDIILDDVDKYARSMVTVDLTEAYFNHPGIYRYKITGEIDSTRTVDGISLCAPLYLDVYISDDESTAEDHKLKVSTKFLHLTTDKDKAISVSSTYESDSVTLLKYVTGNQGDRDRDFTFNVKVTGDFTGKEYNARLYTDKTNFKEVKLQSGKEGSVNLKHTYKLVIYGVSFRDKYQFIEDMSVMPEYKISYVKNKGEIKEGNDTGEILMDKGAEVITFTNNKNTDEPVTGIIIKNIPYIIMIAFVLGLSSLFYVKKRINLKVK